MNGGPFQPTSRFPGDNAEEKEEGELVEPSLPKAKRSRTDVPFVSGPQRAVSATPATSGPARVDYGALPQPLQIGRAIAPFRGASKHTRSSGSVCRPPQPPIKNGCEDRGRSSPSQAFHSRDRGVHQSPRDIFRPSASNKNASQSWNRSSMSRGRPSAIANPNEQLPPVIPPGAPSNSFPSISRLPSHNGNGHYPRISDTLPKRRNGSMAGLRHGQSLRTQVQDLDNKNNARTAAGLNLKGKKRIPQVPPPPSCASGGNASSGARERKPLLEAENKSKSKETSGSAPLPKRGKQTRTVPSLGLRSAPVPDRTAYVIPRLKGSVPVVSDLDAVGYFKQGSPQRKEKEADRRNEVIAVDANTVEVDPGRPKDVIEVEHCDAAEVEEVIETGMYEQVMRPDSLPKQVALSPSRKANNVAAEASYEGYGREGMDLEDLATQKRSQGRFEVHNLDKECNTESLPGPVTFTYHEAVCGNEGIIRPNLTGFDDNDTAPQECKRGVLIEKLVERFALDQSQLLLSSHHMQDADLREILDVPFEVRDIVDRMLILDHNLLRAVTKPIWEKFVGWNLVSLDISCNKLSVFDSAISLCTTIRILNLSRNRLGSIPEGVCELPNLEVLNLRENLICTLPNGFGQLKKLEVLDLSKNVLECLPQDWVDEGSHLWVLSISGNEKFQTFPPCSKHLRKLENFAFDNTEFARLLRKADYKSSSSRLMLDVAGLSADDLKARRIPNRPRPAKDQPVVHNIE